MSTADRLAWETWIAADLLAKAWWSNYDPQDPKGGRHYPGFGGDPEWQKNTGRWLKRYMDAHGRPDSWPWKAPEFDLLDPSKTVDAVAAAKVVDKLADQVIQRQCGPERKSSPEELHEDWVIAYAMMGWTWGEVYEINEHGRPAG